MRTECYGPVIPECLNRESSWIPAFAGMTLLVLFSGCKVEPARPPLVESVAVLPFDNESNDVDASDIMQRLVYLALKPSGYRMLDITEVNDKLEKAGIVDGGQLAAIDPVKLGKDLGIQALMFGNVESFNYTNIGFYVERKVVLELKLVDVGTGQTLWENSGGDTKRQLTMDKNEASKAFVKGVADQLADKIFKTPLEEEAKLATVKTLRTLPGFKFTGFATDDQTPSTAKSDAKGVVKDIIKNK